MDITPAHGLNQPNPLVRIGQGSYQRDIMPEDVTPKRVTARRKTPVFDAVAQMERDAYQRTADPNWGDPGVVARIDGGEVQQFNPDTGVYTLVVIDPHLEQRLKQNSQRQARMAELAALRVEGVDA